MKKIISFILMIVAINCFADTIGDTEFVEAYGGPQQTNNYYYKTNFSIEQFNVIQNMRDNHNYCKLDFITGDLVEFIDMHDEFQKNEHTICVTYQNYSILLTPTNLIAVGKVQCSVPNNLTSYIDNSISNLTPTQSLYLNPENTKFTLNRDIYTNKYFSADVVITSRYELREDIKEEIEAELEMVIEKILNKHFAKYVNENY